MIVLSLLCWFDHGLPKQALHHRKSASFAWLIGCLLLLAFAFGEPLKAVIHELRDAPDWTGFAKVFDKWAAFWPAAGLVTAFFYWILFVRDIRAAYDENETWTAEAKRSVIRALAIGSRRNNNNLTPIYGADFELKLSTLVDAVKVGYERDLTKPNMCTLLHFGQVFI